jgi:hypothetical protein
MVLYKKTAQRKRRLPKKETKKYNLKGGALSQRQIDLLRMLSKIITWGSLGFISICTAMPLIRVISGLLSSAGLDAMTASFYELIWVNLSSTMSSLVSAAGSAGAAAMDGLAVLARTGNLCAAVHATARLANPIYHFALGGIQNFIEIMKNPLNFNQSINRFLSEQTGIIDKFLGDYVAFGQHARSGIQVTAAAERELYEKLKGLITHLGAEMQAAMPKRNAEELAARDANLQWLANSEDFVFSILSNSCEGVNYSTAKFAANKERIYGCARGVAGVAKEWLSYFKNCAANTLQYVNMRKRSRSPSPRHSPPPSQQEMVDLATVMMTQTLPDEEASQYEDAAESLPEVAEMLRGISPGPEQIRRTVREFGACPRRASEPPFGTRPMLRARRASFAPSGMAPPRKEDIKYWEPLIEESPEDNSAKKQKKEGGNNRSTIERKKSSKGSKPNSNKKKQLGGKTRKRKY